MCEDPSHWPWLLTGFFAGLCLIFIRQINRIINATAALSAVLWAMRKRGVYMSPFETALYNKATDIFRGQSK